jgi:DNA-binding transcriptional MerR regulator
MERLKLHDIIANARLTLSTVQYVLKNPEDFPGMPDAGSQGVHRLFTFEQAVRLTICTLLIMGGIPLKQAAAALDFYEKETRKIKTSMANDPRFKEGLATSLFWWIEITDREFLTIDFAGKRIPQDEVSTYSVSRRRVVKAGTSRALSTLKIDIFEIRRALRTN